MVGIDGGELVARTLKAFGVEVAFGLHGGHLDSLLVGLHRNGIRLLDTRHEASAVHAADGYARVGGRLGVAFATAASGYSNALAGLAVAHADRTPLLVLTSSPPLRDAETNALQGTVDQVAMAVPVTKWAHRVTVPEEIPRLLSLAIRKALAGAPGPVLVDLPIDVLFTPVEEARVQWGGGATLAAPPAPSPSALAEAVALLRSAQRPAIIFGGGAQRHGDLLARFVERSGIPAFNQTSSSGALPADHPLYGFQAGNLAVLGEFGPDVVVMLGARPGLFLGGRVGTTIPKATKLIHVDTDASEIGRLLPVAVGLTADVGETLEALLAVDEPWPDWGAWSARATSVCRAESPFAMEPEEKNGRLHPFHALREVMRALDPNATLIIDGGEMGAWTAAVAREAMPKRVMGFGGYLGFLGTGPGLAIGAQLAEPSGRVVLLTGDGAFGFHPQEFDTMVRHGLAILTVVVNNECWGMSIHGQQEVYGNEAGLTSKLADTDYERVAEGFGAWGERVTELDEVGPAVRRALQSGRPACINLAVSGDIVHPITPLMVGMTDDPHTTVIPYYENVVRTR